MEQASDGVRKRKEKVKEMFSSRKDSTAGKEAEEVLGKY